jgi:hypothetical protein
MELLWKRQENRRTSARVCTSETFVDTLSTVPSVTPIALFAGAEEKYVH